MTARVFGLPTCVGVRRLEPAATFPRAALLRGELVTSLVTVAPIRRGGASDWPTPRGSAGGPEMKKLRTPGHTGVNLATALARAGHKGSPNPRWVEWLLGFPDGWTA